MNKIFEEIINYLIINYCSDLHLDFINNEYCLIGIRKQGQVQELKRIDKDISHKLFNYIMFIANIDIINKQTLHTGTIKYQLNHLYYFLRVSVVYTTSSKSIVIRILNNHKKININQLSLIKNNQETLNKIVNFQNGLILFCGKTGSGKTTTLYALIEDILLKKNKKIISLENPIEREINKVLQISVNTEILSYFDVLKQVLRHDPDIIVIGEIRDEDELKLAIKSALSGHLVLASMHAINAIYAINRLLELNANNNDLKACLKLVSYQELVYLKNNEISTVYEFVDSVMIEEYLNNKKIDYFKVNDYKKMLAKKMTFYEGK
ncbi:MAG: Flp pilus assembly complex ATPase component TadA [Bacilli bacterium]|jgi:type II secretory ATPase GspE/PulE/Tfp pilus assembly ATPase PilB-like protein|nr:Flp pilus assembly complex ATPase component TadA [Bacilli bacterium]